MEHGKNGFLVPPREPMALAAAIRLLADNPDLRAEIGRRNRAQAEANLSWARVTTRYLSVYNGALRRRSPRAAPARRAAVEHLVTASRPEIGPALAAAWRHTHAARAELRAWQDARLRRLVLHAYESVPFYRRLFDRHRLHPRHIRGIVDLELIPLTDKAEMRRQGPAGRCSPEGHDPEALLSVRAAGAPGEPFTIRRTWLEDKLQHLLRLRAFRAFGVTARATGSSVVGPPSRPRRRTAACRPLAPGARLPPEAADRRPAGSGAGRGPAPRGAARGAGRTARRCSTG